MRYFIVLLPALFLACGIETDNTKGNSDVRTEVRAMFDAYHHTIAEEGLTGEFPFLDDSPDFFWVPPGYQTALSYDSVRAILERNAHAYANVQFHWDTLDIFPLAPHIASYTGIVGGTMTDTSGMTTQVGVIETGVVIKRSDGWKLLCGQSALAQ